MTPKNTLILSKGIDFNNSFDYFGFDHLEIFLDYSEFNIVHDDYLTDGIIESIDEDNSSFAYIKLYGLDFMYSKINPKGYTGGFKFQTTYQNKSVDCFSIIRGGRSGNLTTKGKLVIHSGFFVLEQNGFLEFTLLDFLKKYIDLKILTNKHRLRRFDLALDVPYSLLDIMNSIHHEHFHSKIGNKKNGTYETLYEQTLSSDKNRNYQFRIYNKVLDSFKKGKTFLFPHLYESKNMTRLELEVRSELCSRLNINIIDLLGNKNGICERFFISKLNNFTKTEIKENSIFLLPYSNKHNDLRENFIRLGHIPDSYISKYNGYTRNILVNTGYSGLFQSVIGIYKEGTKTTKDITYFGKIIPYKERDSLVILEQLILYLKENEKIPGHKINKVLKNYITTKHKIILKK